MLEEVLSWQKVAFVSDTCIVSSFVYNNTSFERSLVAVTVSAQNLLLLVLRSFFLLVKCNFYELSFLLGMHEILPSHVKGACKCIRGTDVLCTRNL